MPTLRTIADFTASSVLVGVPALAVVVLMLVPDAEITAALTAALSHLLQ